MKFFCICFCLLILTGCHERSSLDSLQKKFIKAVLASKIEEGPFDFNYSLKTVFFSQEIVSFLGIFNEYTGLPHGHGYYVGKTYYKDKGEWKEITLNDLFVASESKEFLRACCQRELEQQEASYFSDPAFTALNLSDIHTFVINQHFLIIILQPYVAGSFAEGLFTVKIPIESLKEKWENSHPFCKILDKASTSKNYVSSFFIESRFVRKGFDRVVSSKESCR